MAGQFELREPEASYSGHFKAKKGDIGAVHSNNKCNGILVIVIFGKHLIGRGKTQGFSWAVV